MSEHTNFNINITADATKAVTEAKATQEELSKVGKVGTEATKDVAAETVKATNLKGQFKAAIQGVSREFPALGNIARLALNPITLAVAGITAAFQLWTWRLKELQSTYASGELPDVSTSQLERIHAASKGWGGFAEAFAKVTENYNSAASASDRAMKRLDKELDQKRKLLDAEKDLALARLETERGQMAPGEYYRRKADIENAHDQRGLELDMEGRQKQLEERLRRRDKLAAEAEEKANEAAAIHPADPHMEALMEKKLQSAAEEAEKEIKRRRERMGQLADWQAAKTPWSEFRFRQRYGDYVGFDEARGIERDAMATAQGSIDSYSNFVARKTERERMRGRKQSLEQGAAASMEESARIGLEVYDDAAAANDHYRFGKQLTGTGAATRNYQALGQISQELAQAQQAAARALESGKGLSQEMIRTLRALGEENERTKQQLKQELENINSRARNSRAN